MALRLITPPSATARAILTAGSASVEVPDGTSALVGAAAASGQGIPAGTFVESIDDSTHITLTKAATVSTEDGVAVDLAFAMEAVSIGEAREHLRQTDTSEDRLIARLLAAARRACERRAWRCFLTSTWELTLDQFPLPGLPFLPWPTIGYGGDVAIRIPNPPLVSVASVSYTDLPGTVSTLSPLLYGVTAGTPGLLVPAYGTAWPFTRGQPANVAIRYVAGYGSTADSVPEDAKVAILMMLAHLYDNRGDADAAVPDSVAEMLAGCLWGGYV